MRTSLDKILCLVLNALTFCSSHTVLFRGKGKQALRDIKTPRKNR